MKPPKNRKCQIELRDSRVLFDGQPLPFSQLKFKSEVGRGAHGVVFEAYDDMLERSVAVKIWNKKLTDVGKSRARAEITKLAQVAHPLLITVHNFGILLNVPYAVMEFLPSITVTEWLRSNPSIEDRCAVWSLYSAALRYIYMSGAVHGDPHTGNVLVSNDRLEVQRVFYPKYLISPNSIAVKVVDTGSSLLWASREDFISRESRVVLETATRLFSDLSPTSALDITGGEHHLVLLTVLDCFSEYIAILKEAAEGRAASGPYGVPDNAAEIVGRIVSVVGRAPYFRLSKLLEEIEARRIWGRKHIFGRIGLGVEFFFDGPRHLMDLSGEFMFAYVSEVIPALEKKYWEGRSAFVDSCMSTLPRNSEVN